MREKSDSVMHTECLRAWLWGWTVLINLLPFAPPPLHTAPQLSYPTTPAQQFLLHLLVPIERDASVFRNKVETSMNLRVPTIPAGLIPKPKGEYVQGSR
jgi:hypothetical protein